MKNQRRQHKVLAVLLALIMIVTTLPVVAMAEGGPESPNMWIEYDSGMEGGSVRASDTVLPSFDSVDLASVSGQTIYLTSPTERSGERPIVEIVVHSSGATGQEYDSFYWSNGEDANLTVSGAGREWSFTAPEMEYDSELRVWWSEFDKFEYNDAEQTQIRTNIISESGSGTIEINAPIAGQCTTETYGCKYNVDAENAFGADGQSKLGITFTPSQGYEIDFIMVGFDCFRLNPTEDRPGQDIDESSDFTKNEDGSYTYYLSNTMESTEEGSRYTDMYFEVNYENKNSEQGNNNAEHYGDHSIFEITIMDGARGMVYFSVNNATVYDATAENAAYPSSLTAGDVITVFAKANEGERVDRVEVRVDGAEQSAVKTLDETYGDAYSYTVEETGKPIEFFVEFRNAASDNHQGEGGDPNPRQEGIQFQVTGPDRGTVTYMIGNTAYSLDNLNEEISSNQNSESVAFEQDTVVKFKVTPKENATAFQVHIDSSDPSEDVGANMNSIYQDGFMSELEKGNEVSFTATAGNSYVIRVEFGQQIAAWYTVSWAGGNVTVENGVVLAERVHVSATDSEPAKTYTINENEVDEENNIFDLWQTIGKQKESDEELDSLWLYGLGFSQSDLFIATGLSGVTIDFKFIPDYGYQLKNIYTNDNENRSLLNEFTTNVNNISSFTFSVRMDNNVHFRVVFEKTDDTITTDAKNINGASIVNGQNAVSSGNLSLTIHDAQKDTSVTDAVSTFDVTLDNVVSKGEDQGNWVKNITEFDDPITVTLNLDKNIYTKDNYEVIREHNGVYEKINSKYDPNTGALSFETNKFSTYTIVSTKENVAISDEKQVDNFASGEIKSSISELENAVLTAEDKASIANGKQVEIWIAVKDKSSSVSSVDKASVTNKLPANYHTGTYLDINLVKQVEGSDAENVTQTPNGKVKIGITIPAELQKSGRIYKVIRIHDGTATILNADVDSNYRLTFESDQFSTYALIYKDPSSATLDDGDVYNTNAIKSPKTADTSNTIFWMAILFMDTVVLGLALFSITKRYMKMQRR